MPRASYREPAIGLCWARSTACDRLVLGAQCRQWGPLCEALPIAPLATELAEAALVDACDRNQGGTGLGQLVLRRLVSAPEHASGCPELRPAPANTGVSTQVDSVELVEADQVVAPGSHHVADPVKAATAAVEDVPMQQLQRPAVGTAAGQSSAVWQGDSGSGRETRCRGWCVGRVGLGRVGRARR